MQDISWIWREIILIPEMFLHFLKIFHCFCCLILHLFSKTCAFFWTRWLTFVEISLPGISLKLLFFNNKTDIFLYFCSKLHWTDAFQFYLFLLLFLLHNEMLERDFSQKKTRKCVNFENIARGTTDPGYWVQNLNYL